MAHFYCPPFIHILLPLHLTIVPTPFKRSLAQLMSLCFKTLRDGPSPPLSNAFSFVPALAFSFHFMPAFPPSFSLCAMMIATQSNHANPGTAQSHRARLLVIQSAPVSIFMVWTLPPPHARIDVAQSPMISSPPLSRVCRGIGSCVFVPLTLSITSVLESFLPSNYQIVAPQRNYMIPKHAFPPFDVL